MCNLTFYLGHNTIIKLQMVCFTGGGVIHNLLIVPTTITFSLYLLDVIRGLILVVMIKPVPHPTLMEGSFSKHRRAYVPQLIDTLCWVNGLQLSTITVQHLESIITDTRGLEQCKSQGLVRRFPRIL